MPLCEEFSLHMRDIRRKAGVIGTAAGLLCFVLMDVLVLTAGLNGWLAFGITFVAACVGGAMGGKLFQGIVAQEDHACVDAPVEMILEQDMSKWFLFWNSYYADMFFQLNPHAARVEALPRGRIRKLGDADRLEGLFLKRLFAWMLPLCLLLAFGSMSDDKEGKSTTPAGTYASTDAPAQGEADATAATQSGWEGLWDTTFGELTLRWDGDRFVGEYPSLNGTLEGTVTDRQLSGTYREGDTTGEYWFVMAKDGQSFYGEWKKPGMADWSSWTGKRASNDASDGMDAAAITTEKPITTEPTPTPTPTPEPTPDYPPVDRPETGRLESAAKTKGVAPFKIFTEKETENASDFYLKLVDAESGNTVYVFYVRSGETLDVKVALGTYVLRYASGETWYGPEHLYGPRTRYAEGGDPLAFSQSGNMVYGNSVTLYTVLGGNFDTKNIDAGGF